uniref:Uncharacterized protein n=1 Tax=Oryza punctata TaxID=4537 RepID=A0A0E0LP27_ORYPU
MAVVRRRSRGFEWGLWSVAEGDGIEDEMTWCRGGFVVMILCQLVWCEALMDRICELTKLTSILIPEDIGRLGGIVDVGLAVHSPQFCTSRFDLYVFLHSRVCKLAVPGEDDISPSSWFMTKIRRNERLTNFGYDEEADIEAFKMFQEPPAAPVAAPVTIKSPPPAPAPAPAAPGPAVAPALAPAAPAAPAPAVAPAPAPVTPAPAPALAND